MSPIFCKKLIGRQKVSRDESNSLITCSTHGSRLEAGYSFDSLEVR